MATVERILDQLDQWRHLPDYQLERRTDIIFAAYLPAFLSYRQRMDIRPSLIPEFPLKQPDSNLSDKVDYLALDATGRHAIFIELKTDDSRRDKQDKYLEAAKGRGLHSLLEDLLKIVCASKHKHKYCCLLRLLEKHSLMTLPENLDAALSSAKWNSAVNLCIPNVRITAPKSPIEVFFLQPVSKRSDEIGFAELANWLDTQGDSPASRFAVSLRRWAASPAGR
jgi:hypothetical protein